MPDFFILGAPKCGTTSLQAWLADHHKIFMSEPKEPHYYAPDVVKRPFAQTKTDYIKLFCGARGNQLKGEASTGYLRSRVAVSSILSDNTNAKFVVCLRDPVKMLVSLHAQALKSGLERRRDINKVIDVELGQKKGTGSERYVDICMLGEQVEWLCWNAGLERVHFVFLEDIVKDPLHVYQRVLEFLGVPDDDRQKFPHLNTRGVPNSIALAQLVRFANILKRRFGVKTNFGVGSVMQKYNVSARRAIDVSAFSEDKLKSFFAEDVKKLERFVDRDLSTSFLV